MVSRIKLILKEKKLTQSQFATAINIQRSTLSHILSGRNNPSLDFIIKVVEAFPDISLEWLARGIGNMHNTIDDEKFNNASNKSTDINKEIKTEKNIKKLANNDYPLFAEFEKQDENNKQIVDKTEIKTSLQNNINNNNVDYKDNVKENDISPLETSKKAYNEIKMPVNPISKNEINRQATSVLILFNDGTYQIMK